MAGELPVYGWGEAPETLKTAGQLREGGKRPANSKQPAALLVWGRRPHQRARLYELATAVPVKTATEAQRRALEKAAAARRTCGKCGTDRGRVLTPDERRHGCRACQERAEFEEFHADHRAAVEWAAEVLADPATVVLDTETTDLYPARIVEVSVVGVSGEVLFDSLVNPGCPSTPEALAVHGITEAMTSSAPPFAAIVDELGAVLRGKRVLCWNKAFDRAMLGDELDRLWPSVGAHGYGNRHPFTKQWRAAARWDYCAMEMYAQWVNDWADYHDGYRWQALNGPHRGAGDCLAVLDRLAQMSRDADCGMCAAAARYSERSMPSPHAPAMRDHTHDDTSQPTPVGAGEGERR